MLNVRFFKAMIGRFERITAIKINFTDSRFHLVGLVSLKKPVTKLSSNRQESAIRLH
jgi:hypothetical protein